MLRMIGVFVAMVALVGLSMFHGAMYAQAAAEKQLLCHVSPDEGDHVIEVSVHAVPAHLRNHGDCLINSTDRTLIDQPCNVTDGNGDDICDVQP